MDEFHPETTYERFDEKRELIDAAASRPSSETNYLPESNVRYLLRGETGSYNENKVQKMIDERLESLSTRIQRLIYDITALENSGYLDDVDQNWNYLPDLPKRSHLAIRNLQGRAAATDTSNSELLLGFSIGLALSSLTGTIPESDRASDFIEGFTLAYETDEHDKEQHKHSENDEPSIPRIEVDSRRADVLRDSGIEPTPFLDRMIELHNLAWSSFEGTEILPPDKATENYIEESLGDSFNRHRDLRSKLDEEWDSIRDASVPGAGAQEVLEALWKLSYEENIPDRMTSEKIAEEMGKRSSYKNTVSHVLNQLSEGGKSPSDQLETTYCHLELVQWSGQEWVLTDYGRLLAYYIFEKGQNASWIQRIALSGILPTTEEFFRPPKEAEEILSGAIEQIYER